MPDPKQLPFLLKLMDDESPLVSSSVLNELRAFGPALKEELARLPQGPDHTQREILDKFLKDQNRDWLKSVWKNWFSLGNEAQRLEAAFNYLAQFQNGFLSGAVLKNLLDDIAEEYLATHHRPDALQLSHFLFQLKGLKGAFSDYYNPQNSNLTYVIEHKVGIPISLAMVYIFVADRLGIKVLGCNFPGHFLARVDLGEKTIFVDCFNGGQLLDEKDLSRLNPDVTDDLKGIMSTPTTPEMTIGRVLNNLARAYRQSEEWENHIMIKELLAMMDEKFSTFSDVLVQKPKPGQKVFFKPGQVVRHKKLGLRAIVVHSDWNWQPQHDFQKFDDTKSSKRQPWYHLLIHGSDHVSYAAHNNLEEDDNKEKISHPLLNYFFTQTDSGKYLRNGHSWPGG